MSAAYEHNELPALEYFLRYCRNRCVRAGTMIIHAGDRPESLYYIRRGSAEVLIEDDNGGEMVLAYLNDGDFLGEMGFFQTTGKRSAWVRARTDCQLAEMTYPLFSKLTRENPALVVEISTQMVARLAYTNLKVADLAFLDVSGRVAHALIDLSNQPDARTEENGVEIEITRPQIARMVGATREMVCRVMKVMEHQGLLRNTRKGVFVYDHALGRNRRYAGVSAA